MPGRLPLGQHSRDISSAKRAGSRLIPPQGHGRHMSMAVRTICFHAVHLALAETITETFQPSDERDPKRESFDNS
ncbi:MAG: hypothetical protein ACK55I_11700, partial [bacterium]